MKWIRSIRRWLATPIATRAVLGCGLLLVGYGYRLVWMPDTAGAAADLEQVTRQAVGGILLVITGSALVGAVAFWRD